MTLRKTRAIILTIVLIPPVFILSLLVPAFLRKDNPGFFAHENIAVISSALNQFKMAYGKVPAGDSAAIFRTLLGDNPNHQEFLVATNTNSSGEILDSWGTPYQIQIENGERVVIRSAGRDRVFGDGDDIVYDSAKHDFVSQP